MSKKQIFSSRMDIRSTAFRKSTAPSSIDEVSQNVRFVESDEYGVLLLSRGKIGTRFFTEDSRLYITQKEKLQFEAGWDRSPAGRFDAAHSRFTREGYSLNRSPLHGTEVYRQYWKLKRTLFGFRSYVVSLPDNLAIQVSPARVWNFSIASAIIFGMLSMSFIYKYLGQGVLAKDDVITVKSDRVISAQSSPQTDDSDLTTEEVVLGAMVEETVTKEVSAYLEREDTNAVLSAAEDVSEQLGVGGLQGVDGIVAPAQGGNANTQSIEEKAETAEEKAQRIFEETAREMVAGYPIEKMLPHIFEHDRIVASYLIAIAKKESAWGKRVPIYKGEDCFNYWGYREKRKIMGSGGHTCFNDPKDAVDTVGERIEWFVKQKGYATPRQMVVWKCGYTCEGHSEASVEKWISDVDLYFSKLYRGE